VYRLLDRRALIPIVLEAQRTVVGGLAQHLEAQLVSKKKHTIRATEVVRVFSAGYRRQLSELFRRLKTRFGLGRSFRQLRATVQKDEQSQGDTEQEAK
jgi:hypothetical protein